MFTEPSSGWTDMSQTAELTAHDGAAGDDFGASVSISNYIVVVGAPLHAVGANADEGAAYYFTGYAAPFFSGRLAEPKRGRQLIGDR